VKNPSVIIIRKPKRGGHGGHHGGAWKVAYADFVTAMMAFFLVMWLVAQNDSVKAAVSGYFKDPGIFDYEKSNGVIQGGEMKLDEDTPNPVRIDASDPVLAAAGRKALEQAAEHLKAALAGLPEFKKLEKQVEIQLTPEGLRIELVESNQGTFFDSGSAKLKPSTEKILGAIATELGKLENPIAVEGHTDKRPYSSSTTYTNWELSSDRANAARRVMEALGIHDNQIQTVRGYADRQPRVPDAPYDPRNRRVSIVVQNLELQSSRSVTSGNGANLSAPAGEPGAKGGRSNREAPASEHKPAASEHKAATEHAAPAKPH
jgi:chemotaxis protein MotB